MGEWKGLLQKAGKGNNVMELYNLAEDPRESKDLAAEHPDIVAAMWDAVRESHEKCAIDNPKFNLKIKYPENGK